MNNNRFGFVVVESEDEARSLIKVANGSRLGDFKICLSFAKRGHKKGIESTLLNKAESSSDRIIHRTSPQRKLTKSDIGNNPPKSQEKEATSQTNSVQLKVNESFSK